MDTRRKAALEGLRAADRGPGPRALRLVLAELMDGDDPKVLREGYTWAGLGRSGA